MEVKKTRAVMDLSAKKMRRARHLFVLLNRPRLIDEEIYLVAYKMHEYGLYSQQTSFHSVVFSVCRRLCKLEKADSYPWGWHRWLVAKGIRHDLWHNSSHWKKTFEKVRELSIG